MKTPVEIIPAPITTAEALRLWHALHSKEAAALYDRRDLARFPREAAEVYHPISRMYQTTMAKADEYAVTAKRLRAEARLKDARLSTLNPQLSTARRASHP